MYNLSKRAGSQILLSLFLLLSWGANSTAAPAALSEKSNAVSIAVMGENDFVPDAVTNAAQGGVPEALASRVIQQLDRSKRFNILDRTVLRRSILEQRFGQEQKASDLDRVLEKAVDEMPNVSGITVAASGLLGAANDSLKDFKDLGTATGADYIVYMKLERLESGSQTSKRPYSDSGETITKQETNAVLSIRIIEVANSRVAGAAKVSTRLIERNAQSPSATILAAYDSAAADASDKIIDIIFPAKVVGNDPWVINRGTNDRVKAGDQFELVRNGKEIKDESGIVIGRIQIPAGKIKLTNVQDNLSLFEVLSGEPQKEDLLVKKGTTTTATNKVGATATLASPNSVLQSRPKVAIGLVKARSTATTGLDASAHIPAFTDSLMTRLVQTKRFTLIDRQEVDQLLNEQLAQALTENQELPSDMGQLQGADYLVYGSVSSFMFKEERLRLPGSSQTLLKKVGMVEGNMRIVNALSGEVMASRRVSVKQTVENDISEARLITLLADAYAEQVTMELMHAVYPIKIAALTADGTIYLNRGTDGGLSEQETLLVYQQGEVIVDPDTGISLGKTELKIGEVTLVEVEESRSKARSEQIASLQVGMLLKRLPENTQKRGAANVQQATARSGAEMQKQKGKATLAIGQIKVNPAGKTQNLSPANVERVVNDLYVKLTQSNRFDVLERSQIDQVLDQKAFTAIAQGQDIDPALGELLGADYLIHATIDDFYIETERKQISAVNRTQVKQTGKSNATVRIIDVHTGKTVSADKIALQRLLSDTADQQQVFNELIEQLSTKMVAGVINHIYPIKILGATPDGKIYINRGSDTGIKVGGRFTVARPGADLVDPDTGISFGKTETEVGVIEIQSVEVARAIANAVSGTGFAAGDILRPVPKKVTTQKQVKKVNKPTF